MGNECHIMQRDKTPSVVWKTRCSVETLPGVLGEAFEKVMSYLSRISKAPVGPPYVAYFNEDMQDLEIEIGFPVAEILEGDGQVVASEIPAGKFASTVHTGPYQEIATAYNRLTVWVEEQSAEPAGTAYEIYLNDPADTPPEALQTLILFPLRA
jgi:effector-binding domain-containing protein